MLALVNGMEVAKSTDLMGGKEYKGHTKNRGISLEMLLLALVVLLQLLVLLIVVVLLVLYSSNSISSTSTMIS